MRDQCISAGTRAPAPAGRWSPSVTPLSALFRANRRIFTGSGAWSSVPALDADLPFMYPLELVADAWAGRLRVQGRSAVARTSLLDRRGGLAWAPRAVGMSGSGRAKPSGGPSCGGVRQGWRRLGVTSRRVAAMRACAIQARSSMAWSPGQLDDVGGPDDGVGSEQRDERPRGDRVRPVGHQGARVRAAPIQWPRLAPPRRGCSLSRSGSARTDSPASVNVCSRGRPRCDEGL